MLNGIIHLAFGGVLTWLQVAAPWVWLGLCAAGAIALLVSNPILFKAEWRWIAILAVVGFLGLWVWQHFAGIERLKEDNAKLTAQNAQLSQKADALDASVQNYTKAVSVLEQQQAAIRAQISKVRTGLNSASVIQEAGHDPVKASSIVSTRWSDLDRLFDEATTPTGVASPSAVASPNGKSVSPVALP